MKVIFFIEILILILLNLYPPRFSLLNISLKLTTDQAIVTPSHSSDCIITTQPSVRCEGQFPNPKAISEDELCVYPQQYDITMQNNNHHNCP